jgi:hypothetical protein
MTNIYLTKEEKKKINTIVQQGQKVGKHVDDLVKKVNKEREKNLQFMRTLEKD